MSHATEPRHISDAAKRCLKRNRFTLFAYVLLFVNIAVFYLSDVVGVVEFSLPTIRVDATVTAVESYGPWHHRSSFEYETPTGSSQLESSWTTYPPNLSPGERVVAEVQESDFEHARIVGQRKWPIAIWQAGLLPALALILLLYGSAVGAGRVRLARRGLLAQATVCGDALAFEVVQLNPDAGYRDRADERIEVRVPIPKRLPVSEGDQENVIHDRRNPAKVLVMRAHHIAMGVDGLTTKVQPRSMAWALLLPYVAFLILLLAYYGSASGSP